MLKLNAWERVTGDITANIKDPEERELAERFDRNFNELLKVVPKANRRALIDMIYTINHLYANESWRSYYKGYADSVLKHLSSIQVR